MTTLLQSEIAAIRAGFELRRASRPVFVCDEHLFGYEPVCGGRV